MKKNNIKQLCLMIAIAQMTFTAGASVGRMNRAKNITPNSKVKYEVTDSIIVDSLSYLDENGMKRETIEISPIVTQYLVPVSSTKSEIINGEMVSKEITTYAKRTTYTAPSCATRVEGTDSDMRCFIDFGMRPIQSKRTIDGKTEDVTTYSYGVIYPEKEENISLKLHR